METKQRARMTVASFGLGTVLGGLAADLSPGRIVASTAVVMLAAALGVAARQKADRQLRSAGSSDFP